MPETIVVRWAGPADATSGSRYRVERALDSWSFTELAAAQAAASPYVSPSGVLASNATYGETTLAFVDGSGLSASGFLWLDDALVEWTGKTGDDTLTGVTWHSGYGTYASGTVAYEAHEEYSDSGVTPSLGAVIYRVTHIDASDRESPPTYLIYWYPPAPASPQHCVVVAAVWADLGVEPRAGVTVSCYLSTDDQYALIGGPHLDQQQASTANDQATNAFGLAFFQCWKSGSRAGIGGEAVAGYTFVLDAEPATRLTVQVATVPNRDWIVLLRDAGVVVPN